MLYTHKIFSFLFQKKLNYLGHFRIFHVNTPGYRGMCTERMAHSQPIWGRLPGSSLRSCVVSVKSNSFLEPPFLHP